MANSQKSLDRMSALANNYRTNRLGLTTVRNKKRYCSWIASIDVDVVENVFAKIETVKNVAYRLITEWREQRLAPNVAKEIQEKLL